MLIRTFDFAENIAGRFLKWVFKMNDENNEGDKPFDRSRNHPKDIYRSE